MMSTIPKDLLALQQIGLQALNREDYEAAASAFRKILAARPDYEHGLCEFYLASALEEMGRYEEAKKHYEKALEAHPSDLMRLGALASFLYQYGDPQEAFDAYLRLLQGEREQSPGATGIDLLEALCTLGRKLGMSQAEVKSLCGTE